MIEGFAIIMAVLLAGDFFNKILKVPLPAPVIGLILLVLLLQSKIIKEKKIEKATHLLKYSDKPIIDIANYLSFSSQSHFIQIFESFTGLTPKKYRDRYYKSMW